MLLSALSSVFVTFSIWYRLERGYTRNIHGTEDDEKNFAIVMLGDNDKNAAAMRADVFPPFLNIYTYIYKFMLHVFKRSRARERQNERRSLLHLMVVGPH